jgi:LAS superfamily LD-carboxypeptidase LdcB
MKKIIAIFLFLLAFSISANAQSEIKKTTPEAKATQNVTELTRQTDINDEALLENLYKLFLKKHKELAKENITQSEKQKIYNTVDAKLKASFSDQQIKQFQAVEGLYDKLIK